MIKTIQIKNFKCFQHLQIDSCRSVNVIVGENGSGKTALLEGIFLALGHNPQLTVNIRKRRGIEGSFHGAPVQIEEAMWSDLFNQWDVATPVEIRLSGDGPEARMLTISRRSAESQMSLSGVESVSGPIEFEWTDASGTPRLSSPTITSEGIKFPASGERVRDFYFFGATHPPSAIDMASRFSTLKRGFRHESFVEFIESEYPFIADIGVEVIAGMPMLFATLRNQRKRLAINSISGGLARVVQIALSFFVQEGGVVLIDEIENGIYYKHYTGIWRGLLRLAKETRTQLFISTHSAEILHALHEVGKDDSDRVALLRMDRAPSGFPVIRQFSGADLMAALEMSNEVR